MAKKKSTKKKTRRKKSRRKWSQKIHTVSTFPPEGTFTKDAKSVARIMANKKVSPKGLGSGIRMITMYINRSGKNLEPHQKKELEEAKRILQEKNTAQKKKQK
jgi:tRNA(adenine34) deaminase